jgi:nucleolar complex protein 2
MVKSTKATKKFAKNHLANAIKMRKMHQEQKKIADRMHNKQAKRKRSAVEEVEEDLDLGQNAKQAKLSEVEDDMDVDAFLEKGFFEAMDVSEDEEGEDSEEEATTSSGKASKEEDAKDKEDELLQHKRDLEELKKDKKQASFLAYLEKEAPGLLEGMEDLGDEMDVDGDGEGDESDEKHPVLTNAVLDLWKRSLLKDKSLPALKRLVQAFRVAAHMADNAEETGNPEESRSDSRFSYRINDPAIFNELVVFIVSHFARGLLLILGKSKAEKSSETSDSQNGRPHAGFNSARFPRWAKTKDVTRSFFINLHYFTSQLSDPKMLHFVLRHLEGLIPYLSPFASLQKMFLKTLLSLWSSSTETVRVFAFFCIRKMALELPYPFIDHILKGVYLTYVRNSKFINRTTIPLVNFLCNCVVEIYGIDFVSSYQHAFVYIRELASHLRNSLTSQKKSVRKNIYNFQYINSVNAWVRILAAYPGQETLSLLYYPLVQLLQGTISYQPTNRYFPLRLRCVQMLNELANSSRQFVNAASYLLEILASPDVYKRAKPSMEKTFDLRINLKASKVIMGSKVYQDSIFDETFDLLIEYLAIYSRSIAFPELIYPVMNALTKFKGATHNIGHSKRVKQLQEKIQATVKLIQAKRNQVSFSPKEIAALSNFLGDEPTPLTRLWDEIAAEHKKQQEQLAQEATNAAQKQSAQKFITQPEEDDDGSSDDEDNEEHDSEASELEVLNSDDDMVQAIDDDMLGSESDEE